MLNRKCVACRQINKQNTMLRVAKIENQFVIDHKQKLGGRGAYICNNKNCINLTIKKHLLNKAYKTNVGEEIYNKLGDYEQNC